MADEKKFEEQLLKILTSGGLDKDKLRQASASIVNLKKAGLVIDGVYVKGKPAFDRVLINGIIDPEFWRKFGGLGDFNFHQFEIFPYGIINPEGFKFQITI